MSTRRSTGNKDHPYLEQMLKDSRAWFESLTAEQQEEHLREQAKSWAKQDKD
jgi:hypothetical protein